VLAATAILSAVEGLIELVDMRAILTLNSLAEMTNRSPARTLKRERDRLSIVGASSMVIVSLNRVLDSRRSPDGHRDIRVF
jgi:hypothetical protein